MWDGWDTSLLNWGIQSPAIPTGAVALPQCGHMLTGLLQISWCFDWEMILSHNQNFFCPQYFFKVQFTLLGSFAHCQNLYTWSKTSFIEMQAEHLLRFGSIGLFFRTPKLLSPYFSKLISGENNAEGNVAEVLSYFYCDLLIPSWVFFIVLCAEDEYIWVRSPLLTVEMFKMQS